MKTNVSHFYRYTDVGFRGYRRLDSPCALISDELMWRDVATCLSLIDCMNEMFLYICLVDWMSYLSIVSLGHVYMMTFLKYIYILEFGILIFIFWCYFRIFIKYIFRLVKNFKFMLIFGIRLIRFLFCFWILVKMWFRGGGFGVIPRNFYESGTWPGLTFLIHSKSIICNHNNNPSTASDNIFYVS